MTNERCVMNFHETELIPTPSLFSFFPLKPWSPIPIRVPLHPSHIGHLLAQYKLTSVHMYLTEALNPHPSVIPYPCRHAHFQPCILHPASSPPPPPSPAPQISAPQHSGQKLESRSQRSAHDPFRNERVGKLWSALSCCHVIRGNQNGCR